MINTIIFDMDGVIAKAEIQHAKADQKALNELNINCSIEYLLTTKGIPSKEVFEKILIEKKIKTDLNKLSDKKQEYLLEFIKKEIKPIIGAKELIQRVHNAGFKICVGSSARRKEINLILESLNLIQYFNSITSVDDVAFGKPDPSIFLKAAKKENTLPENCLVIEDSQYGIEAAKRAGMKCIGFKAKGNEHDLSQADLVVNDLKKITIEKIKKLGN
ncbi:MAG: HAD family phosphatase [Candidatus Diapherotrites archaeon]